MGVYNSKQEKTNVMEYLLVKLVPRNIPCKANKICCHIDCVHNTN
jgi:hypothetical protein